MIGGLIGGAIAMSDMKAKTTRFNTAMTGSSRSETSAFIIEGLREGLKGSNMQFVTNHVLAIEYEQKYADDFSTFTDGADAYIDIIVTEAGYVAENESSPYEPSIRVKARVVDASNKEILYESFIDYRNSDDLKDARRSSAEAQSYANIDELVANADEARDRLRIAAKTVGMHIAQQLTQ
jgi:hypothetical protein